MINFIITECIRQDFGKFFRLAASALSGGLPYYLSVAILKIEIFFFLCGILDIACFKLVVWKMILSFKDGLGHSNIDTFERMR